MNEERNKIKTQQNIEEKNFQVIDLAIEEISRHMSSDEYYKLIACVRDYRKKIYELQMSLGNGLCEAYLQKKGRELVELEQWYNEAKDLNVNSVIPLISQHDMNKIKEFYSYAQRTKEYPIQVIKKDLMEYDEKTQRKEFYVADRWKESSYIYMIEIQSNKNIVYSSYFSQFILDENIENVYLGTEKKEKYKLKINKETIEQILLGEKVILRYNRLTGEKEDLEKYYNEISEIEKRTIERS